jgi:ribosomal protein S18 acetylase RimI-like enzyme
MNYRKLQPRESSKYRAIRLESLKAFPNAFGTKYDEAIQIEKFRFEYDIEHQVQERFVIGAFDQENLIGICAFAIGENSVGDIYQMYVKNEYQKKGIGFQLVQKTIFEAQKLFPNIIIQLEVTKGNHNAYNLYQKAGFIEVKNDENEVENIKMIYK